MSKVQDQLDKAYSKQLPKLARAVRSLSRKRAFSFPHLIDADAFPYQKTPCRLMIVGQQTAGWYGDRWDGHLDRGIAAKLVANYRDFALGQHYYRSPFWEASRKVCQGVNKDSPENAFVWTNLLKLDEEGRRPADDVVDEALIPHFNLVPDEVSVLRPDAVVFFTGPNYDTVLSRVFRGANLLPVGRDPVRTLARVEHPRLPRAAFRTYHPGYLRRAGQWAVLDRVIDGVLHPPR
jgi:hypothetical protein